MANYGLIATGTIALITVSGCSQQALQELGLGNMAKASSSKYPPISDSQPGNSYGSGSLTQPESVVVRGLTTTGTDEGRFANPQSREAITSRLGYPSSYDARSDYYQKPDGSYIAIDYDSGGRAVGSRIVR